MILRRKENKSITFIVYGFMLLLTICIFIQNKNSHHSLVLGFHLSFSHRLLKSAANTPQLNPANTLIRPIECRNANNHSEAGICMFSIDCMQNKGVPLSIFYDLRDTDSNHILEARKISPTPSTTAIVPSSTVEEVASTSSTNILTQSLPLVDSSTTSAKLVQQSEQKSSPSTTTAPFPTIPATVSPQSSSKQQQDLSQPIIIHDIHAGNSLIEMEKNKYVISSTNLFSPSTTPRHELISSPSTPSVPSMESARNADGSQPSSQINPNVNAKLQIELDSFQTHLTTLAASSPVNSSNQQHYDIINNNNNDTTTDEELISTLNSAHSPPISSDNTPAQQQFSTSGANLVVDHHHHHDQQQKQHHHHHQQHHKESQQQQQITPNSVSGQQESTSLEASHNTSNQQQTVVFPSSQPTDMSGSVYLVTDNHQQPSNHHHQEQLKAQQQQQQQNIVFANNHKSSYWPSVSNIAPPQTASFSSPPETPQSSPSLVLGNKQQQVNSDQEFTLSSSPSSSILPMASNSVQKESLASTTTALPQDVYDRPLSTSEQQNNQAGFLMIKSSNTTSSPFFDLVSSNSVQTTTPFTTSLSTALLPNISAHQFSPTTPATTIAQSTTLQSQQQTSLVPHQLTNTNNQTTSSSLSSTTPSASSTFSPSTTILPIKQSSQATQSSSVYRQSSSSSSTTSETPPLAYVSHLYSSHPSSSSTTSSNYSPSMISSNVHDLLRPTYNHLLPGYHAPSSKIVTGSSSTNNLIPGLSGLQSAILSHIPFKLASGLSTGLSNYLQAAMKPTGSRPLLSSNNAPATQYQQQLLSASNNNSSKNSSPTSSGSAVRFPGSISSSSTTTSPKGPSADSMSISNASQQQQGNWQLNSNNSSTTPTLIVASSLNGITTSGNLNDVVREAQHVCGRPQVSPGEATGNAASNKKRVARIVGGNQSLFGQWPWMVSLRQWRKGAFLHKCGAALLNENWAITAAHCVENVKPADLLLRLGEFDVSNQDEPYPYIERRVKSVVSHPSFDPKTFEYDLALLKFAEPIKYERNVIPVCVPSGNDSYVDRMATVIGWGRLYEDGPLPDIIQHVDVPIITNNECEKMYKNAGYIEEIPDMFICAGINKGGRDSCEGDSGGPLTMVDHDGRSYLVGIISWGIGCALPSQPGVYTRITAFSGWINQITAF